MINDKLVQSLKKAGFPQGETEKGPCMDDDMKEVVSKDSHSLVPTLSELINECGDDFARLETHCDCEVDKTLDKWCAMFVKQRENETTWWNKTHGKTPEEAVARLWIRLQKPAKEQKIATD